MRPLAASDYAHLITHELSGKFATEVLPERRQIVELAIRSAVTEHCVVTGTYACGHVQRSAFPDGLDAPVQYGPGLSALAVYMTQYQLLP